MSSLHSDKGWLVIAFRLGGKQVRLYPGLRAKDTRANMRAARAAIKEIRDLILRREWATLARRFPECKHLDQFRPVFTQDATTFRQAAERFLAFQADTNKPATVKFYRDIIETHITGGGNAESKGSSRLKKSHGDSLRLGGEVESTRTPAGDTNLTGRGAIGRRNGLKPRTLAGSMESLALTVEGGPSLDT